MPHRRTIRLFITGLLLAVLAGSTFAQEIVIAPDRADGVYVIGSTVRWHIRYRGEPAPSQVDFVIKRGGLTELSNGSLTFQDGAASVQADFDRPGTLLLEVKAALPENKQIKAWGGAVAAPRQIQPSAQRPEDFEAFWEANLKKLASVPANPQLESADAGKPDVSYWKITMDNVSGRKINGQIARPASGDKLPALLIVQWAGVYGLQKGWVVDRAAEGWLALNILPHDLPIDRPEEFYKEQSAGPLKDYPRIGNDDPQTSYFLPMYLSCYRAAEYLSQRPDWDGKTLVVMGASQGGQQTLVTAALFPRFTAALAHVPAGCDMLGPDAGRQPGWPQWYWQVGDKDARKVRGAARYFDVVNFAPRIKCPVLVSAGLIDTVCPPEGIIAAANQVPAPVELVILPIAGHQNEKGSQKPYDDRCWREWLPALRQGQPAPVQPASAGAH